MSVIKEPYYKDVEFTFKTPTELGIEMPAGGQQFYCWKEVQPEFKLEGNLPSKLSADGRRDNIQNYYYYSGSY